MKIHKRKIYSSYKKCINTKKVQIIFIASYINSMKDKINL